MTVDLHSLIAPYALHALDSHECARFEVHLDQCADCQAELAGFVATAARLGEAEQQTVPTGLRDRLVAAVASTPQERPVVAQLSQRSKLRRTLPRLAMAAAFLVGTVGVGGYVVERDQLGQEKDRNVSITSVFAASDADTTTKRFKNGGNMRMISSASQDSAVIVANALPNPGKDKVYQVWMIRGTTPDSQGTFRKNGTMIMKGVEGVDRIAVTVEPDGGSKQPTSAPITTIAV